jgi:hypothetical protein
MQKLTSYAARVLALIALQFVMEAQDTRGMIFGVITDPQSSPVAGVAVVVSNVETNVTFELRTNATGYYEANLLVAGSYRVSAEAPGFKQFLREGIELSLGGRVPINIILQLGQVTERITVTEEAPLIETNAVSTGRIVDNRSLTDLPVPRNNPVLLAAFAPGVQVRGGYRTNAHRAASIVTTVLFTPGNVGGRSASDSSNDYLIDGMPNLGNNRRIAFMPHTDSIQEFKVETSNLDPSVGHAAGIGLSLMTKAGTNDLHGMWTWQHMQQRWNATPFFIKQAHLRNIAQAVAAGDSARADSLRNGNPQQPGRTNDYSASLGGPVVLPGIVNGRNKLFFFANFNGTNERLIETTSSINVTVPTLLNRQGNFSDLLAADPVRYQIYDPLTVAKDPSRPSNAIRQPFPGNIVPRSRWNNPMIDFYNSLLPAPNNSPTDPRSEPLNNYVATAMPWTFDYYSLSNRIDYQHSERHRFFGRWNWSNFKERRSDWAYETLPGLQSSDLERATKGAMMDWVLTPTGSTFFDFAFSANQYRDGLLGAVTKTFRPTDVGLPEYLNEKAAGQTHLPVVAPAGYREMGRDYTTQIRATVLAGKADVSHVRGTHTMRAGFGVRQYLRTGGGGGNTSGRFPFDNTYTRRNDDLLTPAGSLGHSWAAFLLGQPTTALIDSNDNWATHTALYSLYVHDNWRVTPRLILLLGLRTEWEGGMTERFDRTVTYFDPTLSLPISNGAEAAAKAIPDLSASTFSVRGGTVYAGQGSTGRSVWQSQTMWLPRLGAAYLLTPTTVLRGGYGVFYDSLNALYIAPNQFGYSRTTATNMSNDFGQTWLAGDPLNGVSPLRDPFPVRSDGTRFDQPVRSSLGSMAFAGRGFSYQDYGIERARNQRWRVGVQRQLGPKTLIEAAYTGSYADRVYVPRPSNPLPEQYWATGNQRNDAIAANLNRNVTNPFQISNFADLRTSSPAVYQQMSTLGFFTSGTARLNQLLRPFPQMADLTQSAASAGEVWTNALELTFQRRLSQGVTLNVNYTRLQAEAADIFLNEFDAAPTRQISPYGAPHRFNATTVADLPFGKGRPFANSGVLSQIFGGFQIGVTYEYQTGLPLDFPNLFFYGELGDIADGPGTLDQWFNTANFERNSTRAPAAFHRRVFPQRLNGVRGQSMNEWNANAQREFAFSERWRLQFRLDALNLMNRTIFSTPDTNPLSSNFGRITATTEAPNRYLQFQVRLRF